MKRKKVRTVAVTGAAGTVGGYVVEDLLRRGYYVIAIDRPSTLDHLKIYKGVITYEIDLTKDPNLVNCFCGSEYLKIPNADAIIHLAADLDIRKSYKDLADINMRVPIELFKALTKSNGKVFIHFSTGSVYADSGPYELDEGSPVKGKSGYELSKIRSEECLQLLAGFPHAPKLIILRPSLIYGPRGRFLVSGVMSFPAILQFFFGDFAPQIYGGPKTNLVHAEDVARAAVFLLENETKIKSGEVFNVADDSPVGFGEVIDAAIESYGLKRIFPLPLPPAFLMAPFKRLIDTELFFKIFDAPIDAGWWLVRKKYGISHNFSARFEKEMAPYFVKNTVFSNEKIKELGFTFKYPSVRHGMKNVIEWYRENNWIPKKVKPFWQL